MIKPDVATELERVNEKLASYMTEDHNILIDKLDLLIKMMKRNENYKEKIAEASKLLDEFLLKNYSPWAKDELEKIRKILKS